MGTDRVLITRLVKSAQPMGIYKPTGAIAKQEQSSRAEAALSQAKVLK